VNNASFELAAGWPVFLERGSNLQDKKTSVGFFRNELGSLDRKHYSGTLCSYL
jgi:hypothetical protein